MRFQQCSKWDIDDEKWRTDGRQIRRKSSQKERIESVSLYESDQGVAAMKKQGRGYARLT